MLEQELDAITVVLRRHGIEPFIFVDRYHFDISQEREMMDHAFAHISQSDLLIAETSYKGIGIGVEVGYAKAQGIPIIYLRHSHADHSTTVSGTSDFHFFYTDTHDLAAHLTRILTII